MMATFTKLERSYLVCPNCGDPNHMHHLVGANVGYWDMKCFNCNSYFNFDELYKHRIAEVIKPKTNADRIRAMRDEEMAELLRDYQCNTCDFSGFCEETDKCKEEIFKWLTQEVQQ